jgi:hypothetical protein
MENVCCLHETMEPLLILFTWKSRSVPSRSARIRISIEKCVSDPLSSNGTFRLSGVMSQYGYVPVIVYGNYFISNTETIKIYFMSVVALQLKFVSLINSWII